MAQTSISGVLSGQPARRISSLSLVKPRSRRVQTSTRSFGVGIVSKCMSQTRAVVSLDPVMTRVPSGLKATEYTR